MPILKKNGKPYQLSGPNPLMLKQESWENDSVLKFHNFNTLQPIVTYEVTESVEEIEEEPAVKLPLPEVILPPPEIVMVPKPVEIKVEKSAYRNFSRNTFLCLAGRLVEDVDELYGDKTVRLTYGDTFKFQGAVVEQTDLQCTVWTTVKQVTVGSIVYHPDAMRWWKVDKIHNDATNDGLILNCVISDLQPDFSSLV